MKSTVAIIGTGNVGSTTAYALLLKNLVSDVILVDIDKARCKGELLDLADTLPFVYASSIVMGDFKDARDADIIIITAGKPQEPGQARSQLLQVNKAIVSSIIKELEPLDPQTVVIVVTNPMDTLTYLVKSMSSLEKNRIIGTGTFLDTQRLRTLLTQKIGIAEQSIDAYVLGEHGDSLCINWSTATIAGMPLEKFNITQKDKKDISESVRAQVYEIIKCKGSTYYGIASCICSICESIIFDQKRVIPVSSYIPSFDVCMSLPTVVGAQGVEKVLFPALNSDEEQKLKECAKRITADINQL